MSSELLKTGAIFANTIRELREKSQLYILAQLVSFLHKMILMNSTAKRGILKKFYMALFSQCMKSVSFGGKI